MTIILVPSQHLVTLTAVSEHLIMKIMLGTQFDYLLTEVQWCEKPKTYTL